MRKMRNTLVALGALLVALQASATVFVFDINTVVPTGAPEPVQPAPWGSVTYEQAGLNSVKAVLANDLTGLSPLFTQAHYPTASGVTVSWLGGVLVNEVYYGPSGTLVTFFTGGPASFEAGETQELLFQGPGLTVQDFLGGPWAVKVNTTLVDTTGGLVCDPVLAAPVPEPQTYALFAALGLVGFAVCRRTR